MTAIRFPVPSMASVEKRCRPQYSTMESGVPASFLARLNCFSTDSMWPEADCREGNTNGESCVPSCASSVHVVRLGSAPRSADSWLPD